MGFFVGLSGVGGSAILAPMLILFLGVKPSLAIGTDLLYSVPAKILALVLHQRQGNVNWPITRALLVGGLPGAIGGLVIFAQLKDHVEIGLLDAALRHAIGVAILLASAGAAALWLARFRQKRSVPDPEVSLPFVTIVAIGAVVGVLVAVTSIGSGSITLPLLAFALPAVLLRRLIGAEIAFAAFLVPVAAVGHIGMGDVNWLMVASLLVGALPGVWIGSRLCNLIGDHWLRPVVIGVLAFAGARLV